MAMRKKQNAALISHLTDLKELPSQNPAAKRSRRMIILNPWEKKQRSIERGIIQKTREPIKKMMGEAPESAGLEGHQDPLTHPREIKTGICRKR
ncbi:MAG: hypothetical protein M1169_01140 [Firmicutes bacterium]|nr:hypothetical protein [Bacillota bacterium]